MKLSQLHYKTGTDLDQLILAEDEAPDVYDVLKLEQARPTLKTMVNHTSRTTPETSTLATKLAAVQLGTATITDRGQDLPPQSHLDRAGS